jgi:sugar lactone lactonase YvrE
MLARTLRNTGGPARPKFFDAPRRQLPFSGVYSIYKGKLQLINKELNGPNGIAFSPDEKYLYVGNWDEKKKVVMRYTANADGKTLYLCARSGLSRMRLNVAGIRPAENGSR